jgi:hypothetical protein
LDDDTVSEEMAKEDDTVMPMRSYYERHKKAIAEKNRIRRNSLEGRRYWQTRRLTVKCDAMLKLGGVRCVRCGCSELAALEINHINGGGHREQVETRRIGYVLHCDIVAGRRKTDDLNVLCRVCNAVDYLERKYPEMKGMWVIIWRNRV